MCVMANLSITFKINTNKNDFLGT